MEVWIVDATNNPEGSYVMGVFASRELAIDYMKQEGRLLRDGDNPVYCGEDLDYFLSRHTVREG